MRKWYLLFTVLKRFTVAITTALNFVVTVLTVYGIETL